MFYRIASTAAKVTNSIRYLPALVRSANRFNSARFIPTPAKTSILRNFVNRFQFSSVYPRLNRLFLLQRPQPRPNSLVRAFSGLAAAVQLRDQFKINHQQNCSRPVYLINKASAMLSSKKDVFLFKNLLLSATKYSLGVGNITPKDFLGAGCNSAVWSVGLHNDENINSTELAVKVLYNYYDDSATVDLDDNLPHMDWHLLRKQLVRECNARPENAHPNIVPILGHFIDKVPPGKASQYAESRPDVSTNQKPWAGAENYPEGFGGGSGPNNENKKTCYLLMPKFEGTLADLIEGKSKSSLESHRNDWECTLPSTPESPGSTRSSASFSVLNETSSSSCSFFNDSAKSIDIKSRSRGTAETSDLEELQPQKATLTDDRGFFMMDNKTPSVRSISTTDEPESISVSISDMPRNNNSKQLLSTDEGIAVLAQIFEAIHALEQRNIAHRDIKLNNFLIRSRNIKKSSDEAKSPLVLDNREARLLNSNILVALTDFGCAIPTKMPETKTMPRVGSGSSFASLARQQESSNNDTNDMQQPEERSSLDQLASIIFKNPLFWSGGDGTQNESGQARKLSLANYMGPVDQLSHSGNTALLAPEVSMALKNGERLTPELYARADLWAAATLAYSIFGLPNPFYQDLDSATYKESELPQFPPSCPGPVALLMLDCLRRDPKERPPAHLVADVLHTICLVRHARRRVQRAAPNARSKMNSFSFGGDEFEDSDHHQVSDIDLLNLDGQSVELRSELNKDSMNYWQLLSLATNNIRDGKLATQLLQFLQVWWAADWLLGPGRAPDGIRCAFYRRLTLDKLNLCLKVIRKFEARQGVMLARRMFSSS